MDDMKEIKESFKQIKNAFFDFYKETIGTLSEHDKRLIVLEIKEEHRLHEENKREKDRKDAKKEMSSNLKFAIQIIAGIIGSGSFVFFLTKLFK